MLLILRLLAVLCLLQVVTIRVAASAPPSPDITLFVNGTFTTLEDGVPEITSLTERAVNGFYVCSQSFWKGNCFWTQIDPSQYGHCAAITSNGGWASLGPDPGIMVDLYRDTQCQQLFWKDLIFPGDPDAPARLNSSGVPPVKSDQIGAVFRAQG